MPVFQNTFSFCKCFFKNGILFFVFCLVLFVLSACGKNEPQQVIVRNVKLLEVGAQSGKVTASYAAQVQARVESNLGFQVAGKVVSRKVELGQRVKKGQVLAELDARDYQLAAGAANAQVLAAKTQRDTVALQVKRFQALREKGFISEAEMEQRSAELKAANAALSQANAQLAAQNNQTAYTKLKADASGIITAINIQAGQVIGAGMPVIRLAQDGARDVIFDVPENIVSLIRKEQSVSVSFSDTPQNVITAKVRDIAASADPATRTFTIKAALHASNKSDLLIGQTASAVLDFDNAGQNEKQIFIPATALVNTNGQTSVWIYEDATQTVTPRPVTIGEFGGEDGNQIQITSGIEQGAKIVTTGTHVLNSGDKVGIYKNMSEAVGDGLIPMSVEKNKNSGES